MSNDRFNLGTEPSEEELKKLRPFCQCYVCLEEKKHWSIVNWFKESLHLHCRGCCGCLQVEELPTNRNIYEKTKEYLRQIKAN